MSKASQKEYKELLEDICSEYCKPGHYCILKEFLVASHTSPRLLTQLKCVDKFKFEESDKAKKDVGWAKAMERWVEEGWAKKFADAYEEGVSFSVIYKKVRNDSSQ